MTTNTPPEAAHLPPDPTAYDSPRNAIARDKGLEAPYIVGGEDPDPAVGLAEERKLLRWLLWMVAALVPYWSDLFPYCGLAAPADSCFQTDFVL